MKKILFCGDFTQNAGPANVNKSMIKYLEYEIVDTKQKNKIKIIASFFRKIFKSDVVVFSCNHRINYTLFLISKILKKNTVYLMHGYKKFEASENKLKNSDRIIKLEEKVLKKVDLIITVSKLYKDKMIEILPHISKKIDYISNGFDENNYENIIKCKARNKNNIIAVCGSNRKTKNNDIVCKAVNELNLEGYECKLEIYGLEYEGLEKLPEGENIHNNGRIPQKELFNALSNSRLFILNCTFESFGLSVIDALMCGCNVLVSKNAGVTSILDLSEDDIIENPKNITELKEKIKINLKNDNNERILEKFNFEEYNWKNVAKRFDNIISKFFKLI